MQITKADIFRTTFMFLLILMAIPVALIEGFKCEEKEESGKELEDLTTERFISKSALGFLFTFFVFAIVGIIDFIRTSNAGSIYDVFVYVLLPEYAILAIYGLYSYIRKKLHPFSGQIKSYKDVDAFLVNYKYFVYTDPDFYSQVISPNPGCYYFISTSIVSILIDGIGFKYIKLILPGVYFTNSRENYNDIRQMNRLGGSFLYLREKVWNDRKLINVELRRRREVCEKIKSLETNDFNKKRV